MIAHKIDEQIEDPRLHLDCPGAQPQLSLTFIQFKAAEAKYHGGRKRGRRR